MKLITVKFVEHKEVSKFLIATYLISV